MKRKLILKTIASLLMLGGCVALTTCTKQKPNVLQTQQVKRAIDNFDTNANGVADIDLSYLSVFYFMPLNRLTISNIDLSIKTSDSISYYDYSISLNDLSYSQKEYFIIAIYNINSEPSTPVSADNYYYAIYSYSILDNNISFINNYVINDNDIQYESWEDLEVINYNGFIGTYTADYSYFETTQNALNEINSLITYKAPSFVEDLNNTITSLQIDYRDAMREVNALETIVESKDNEISSLNDRIDNLNTLHEQEITELENTIAAKEAVIENLQELDNLPTHLGGWMQLVINLLQNLWNMELLPHVKLGYFVALPILFTLVSLLIKLVRGA